MWVGVGVGVGVCVRNGVVVNSAPPPRSGTSIAAEEKSTPPAKLPGFIMEGAKSVQEKIATAAPIPTAAPTAIGTHE